jgi:hypothetical protein
MLDQQVTQPFDGAKKSFAFLLDQHAAEQNAERTNVAAQRKFFSGIGSVCRQLGQPSGLSAFAPQGMVGHGIF